MALKIKAKKSGPAIVTKQKSSAGTPGPEDTNTVEVPEIQEPTTDPQKMPLAEIQVDMSMTINLGNYESVRLGVSLTRTALDNPKAIDKKYTEVKDWVEDKLSQLRDDVES